MKKVSKSTKNSDSQAMVNPFFEALTPAKKAGGTTPKQQIAHELAVACLSPSKLHREIVPAVKRVLSVLATRPDKLTSEDREFMTKTPYFAECLRLASSGKSVNVHLLRGLTDPKNGFKLFAAFIGNGEKDENGQFQKMTTSQAAAVFGRIASCPVSATLVAGFVGQYKSVSFGKLSGKDWVELARCIASGENLPADLDVSTVANPAIETAVK